MTYKVSSGTLNLCLLTLNYANAKIFRYFVTLKKVNLPSVSIAVSQLCDHDAVLISVSKVLTQQ